MTSSGSTRITEQVHPLTKTLDQLPVVRALACFQQTEMELYEENAWGGGLLDAQVVADLERIAARVAATLADRNGRVIFAGAGTSGRLACLAAAQWTRHYGTGGDRVYGLLAGGWDAYYHAQEVVEDSVSAGMDDIAPFLAAPGPVVYIGISCGLSAAYVAGQLALCRKRAKTTTVALGFTPITTSVDRGLPGLPRATASLRELLAVMENEPDTFLLTPMIGAEPIAGSTRLKGGSATRIILDVIARPGRVRERLLMYRTLLQHLRKQTGLSECVAWAGEVLKRGGALTYVAAGAVAAMALLDASECPPTFGAKPFQVQALCEGLAQALPAFDGADHTAEAYHRRARPEDGYLFAPQTFSAGLQQWRDGLDGAKQRLLLPYPEELFADTVGDGPLRDLWFKWQFTAVSTLAFVAYGKVLGNRMIDLRISNQKLWHRALLLIAAVAGVKAPTAKAALHTALGCDPETDMETKIRLAVKQERLIAWSVLIARGHQRHEALRLLAGEPRLTTLLNQTPPG